MSDHLVKMKELIDRTFSTPTGEELLSMLKEDFCDGTVVKETTELTYYSIGQKELIESIINIKNDDKFLEKISTIT